MKKTWITIAAAVGVLLLLYTGLYVWVRVTDDVPSYAKMPTKSKANQLLVTSNGCCFMVEDLRIFLEDDSGERVILDEGLQLRQRETLEYAFPELDGSPVRLVVECHVDYAEQVPLVQTVLEVDSVQALRDTGVLLYFDEGGPLALHVLAGDYHVSYELDGEGDPWALNTEPPEVYA